MSHGGNFIVAVAARACFVANSVNWHGLVLVLVKLTI